MKIAVLADVHANLPALEAVVEDFRELGAECLWHLGDAVGYGADPFTCMQLLTDLDALFISGNHEIAVLDPSRASGFNPMAAAAITWTRNALSTESLAFVEAMPIDAAPLPGVLLFHGLPGRVNGYLRTVETAQSVLAQLEESDPRLRISFFGHTHQPMVFTRLPGRPIRMFEPKGELFLAPARHYLVNPGSVGQPRNGDPRAQYLLYDTDNARIHFRRIKYDIPAAQSRILKAGLPPSLAARLSQGL